MLPVRLVEYEVAVGSPKRGPGYHRSMVISGVMGLDLKI